MDQMLPKRYATMTIVTYEKDIYSTCPTPRSPRVKGLNGNGLLSIPCHECFCLFQVEQEDIPAQAENSRADVQRQPGLQGLPTHRAWSQRERGGSSLLNWKLVAKSCPAPIYKRILGNFDPYLFFNLVSYEI